MLYLKKIYYSIIPKRLNRLESIVTIGLVALIVYFLYQLFFMGAESFDNHNRYPADGNPHDQKVTCTMYYAPWCGACKGTMPEWDKFASMFNGKTIGGKRVMVLKVDCEDDKNKEIAKEQNIKAYPTFKFEFNGRHFPYDGESSVDGWKTFLESVIRPDNA